MRTCISIRTSVGAWSGSRVGLFCIVDEKELSEGVHHCVARKHWIIGYLVTVCGYVLPTT